MKPKILKIKGLNSFIEERTINFEKLTSKGLFGIFGPTGSGKSTILDAITLSLYGEISRANRSDRDFINSNLDICIVSLEFEIGKLMDRKTYVVQRSIGKTIKDEVTAYKTKKARVLEIDENGEKIVIAEKSNDVSKCIQSILGLSLDDFTRSVVLPQGKFSEFLKLSGKERCDMLERIFNLESYGKLLVKKIKHKKNKNLTRLNNIKGQIETYGDISIEETKKMQEEIEILQKEENMLIKKKYEAEENLNKTKELWNLQQELIDQKNILDKLENQRNVYEENKILVEKGQKANNLKPQIQSLNSTIESIKSNSNKLYEKEKEFIILEKELKVYEENFKKWEQDKNDKIPYLIEKKADLSYAIKILDKIKKLSKQKEEYANSWITIDKSLRLKENEISVAVKSLDKVKSTIEENENFVTSNKIDMDFRLKIQKALELEKDYNKLILDIDEFVKEKEIIDNEIKQSKKELAFVKKDLEDKSKELNEYENKLKSLKCPGDYSDLNIKEKQFLDKKNNINLLKEQIKEKTNLKLSLKEIKDNIKNKTNEKQSKNTYLKDLQQKLEQLEVEIQKIKELNLAKILLKHLKDGQPCPVCGSTHHKIVKVDGCEENFKDQEIKVDKLKESIKQCELDIYEIEIYIAKLTSLKEDKEIQLKKYENVDENIDLKMLDIDLNNEKNDLNKFEQNIKQYESKKEKLNDITSNINQNMTVLQSKKAALNSKIEVQLNNFTIYTRKLERMKSDKSIKEEKYKKLKYELNVEDLEQKNIDILKTEELIQGLLKKNRILNKEINEKNIIIQNLNLEIKNIEVNKKDIETRGNELKNQILDLESQCKKEYLIEDSLEELPKIENLIEKINTFYNKYKKLYEDTRDKKEEVIKEKEAYTKEKYTLEKIKKEQESKIEMSLQKYEFYRIEDAIKYFLEEEIIENINKDIKIFENKLTITLNNIETLNKKLNGRQITKEEFEDIKMLKLSLDDLLKEKHDLYICKSNDLKDMKIKLEKCKELVLLEKQIQEKVDLISQIDGLIYGNKFVEYVAKSQLKYICKEASNTLKDISRDRYNLEIDSLSNFIIVDNYNGGERRKTSSLSGGETFLVSLSLALSLSSQIQLKGSCPLEFFFLDEGFGTLDSELLDIVMTSLERLNNDKLSIGIISHVDELKQRIPIKLIVTPARPGEGGTDVKIEY